VHDLPIAGLGRIPPTQNDDPGAGTWEKIKPKSVFRAWATLAYVVKQPLAAVRSIYGIGNFQCITGWSASMDSHNAYFNGCRGNRNGHGLGIEIILSIRLPRGGLHSSI
jgi:hypothetical protein